jgi:hypothetical protein
VQHLKGNAALTFATLTGQAPQNGIITALTIVLCEIREVVTRNNALVSILPDRAPLNEAAPPKGLSKFLMSTSSRRFLGRAKHQLPFNVQILLQRRGLMFLLIVSCGENRDNRIPLPHVKS